MPSSMRNYKPSILLFLAFFLSLQLATFCNSAPLSTNSRWIVNSAGQRVKLACVNWVSHLEPMIAEGLEKQPLDYIAKQIVSLGFNCVRFTWPTYMFTRPEYGSRTVSQSLDIFKLSAAKAGITKHNPWILNMKVVDLHKAVVDNLGKNNIMVVLDNHLSLPGWCCGDKDGNGFFGDSNFDPKEWLRGLAAVATAYKGNPAVIGMSLRNELRGKGANVADWYNYMHEGAVTVHRTNPDFLVIVSGLNYDRDLSFLKSKSLPSNLNNKLVYEAHWYSFGTKSAQWTANSNRLCRVVTQRARDNYLFLTNGGSNAFPLFLSEFGINLMGDNEADNRYITCLLATAAELDLDSALWALQGSYILREGIVNHDELYGILDLKWLKPKNPAFLDRLYLPRRINQDYKSFKRTHYLMYHPQSGQCVQVINNEIILTSCKTATWWNQYQDNGPIRVAGNRPQCLGVGGDGATARISNDCSIKWKSISSSGLHVAAQDGKGKYLCLEKNASNSKLVTKKCLCVGDNLADLPTCGDNPQVQWFKFVPYNV